MTDATPPSQKRLFFVRHAQAEHNVFSDWDIRDPALTKIGRRQASGLDPLTRDNVQLTAELLVSSPQRRTMETMLLAFPDLRDRLEAEGKPVILLDIAQEASDLPCDTPLYPPEALAASNDGMFLEAGLDFSTLSPDYATNEGIFDIDRTAERAREVRMWLRARPEREIVLVAHGDILRWIVDCEHSSRRWHNAEMIEFSFASDDDEDALIVQRGSGFAQLQLSAAINAEHHHAHLLRKEEAAKLEKEQLKQKQELLEKVHSERERVAKEKLERDKAERRGREARAGSDGGGGASSGAVPVNVASSVASVDSESSDIGPTTPPTEDEPTLHRRSGRSPSPNVKLREKCHECKGTKEMAKWVY